MRKLSYISGTSKKPLIGQTIGVFFDHIVEKYPDNLAVISMHQDVRWTVE
jgi:fatty-acyl-CoA synthase